MIPETALPASDGGRPFLDTGVSDGLGDGGQSGIVGERTTETVGDVAHGKP